jgi:hypothetical protein
MPRHTPRQLPTWPLPGGSIRPKVRLSGRSGYRRVLVTVLVTATGLQPTGARASRCRSSRPGTQIADYRFPSRGSVTCHPEAIHNGIRHSASGGLCGVRGLRPTSELVPATRFAAPSGTLTYLVTIGPPGPDRGERAGGGAGHGWPGDRLRGLITGSRRREPSAVTPVGGSRSHTEQPICAADHARLTTRTLLLCRGTRSLLAIYELVMSFG